MGVFGNILGSVGGALLEFALPALGTAIGALVVGIASRYLKRLGLELTDAQARRLRELVTEAVEAVEEMGRRNPALKGEEKRETARTMIFERLMVDDELSNAIPNSATLERAIDAAVQRTRPKPVPSTPATFGR